MMYPTDVNSGIKQSAYVSISLACFAFVLWQSVQCIEKYINNPQGTKLSLQRTSKLHQFPAITICPAFQMYDEKQLKKCGLRYDKLFIHNTQGHQTRRCHTATGTHAPVVFMPCAEIIHIFASLFVPRPRPT